MEATIEGRDLVVRLPLEIDPSKDELCLYNLPESSKKLSRLLASTHGVRPSPVQVDGHTVSINVSAFVQTHRENQKTGVITELISVQPPRAQESSRGRGRGRG